MTFRQWQLLSPEAAAREVIQKAQALGKTQYRAAIAELPEEPILARRFAAAPKGRPLSGIPYFVKDLFDTAGSPTRAGSSFLAEVRPVPQEDSAIVKAFGQAGAVLAGKTQLHEFAYGLTGENPHFGDCEHPLFPGRTTGGSSSGSVAVVASGIAPLSIGTDTGGSVRVPAAFCGLHGFRMSPHHPWIADAFPLASSFDTAGWFTSSAGDMRISLEALVGLGGTGSSPRGLYLPMPGLEPDVASVVRSAALALASEVGAGEGKNLRTAFAGGSQAYAVLQSSEAFKIHEAWLDRYRSRYGEVVWSRIDRGRHWTQAERSEAAERMAIVRRTWEDFFDKWDFMVLAAAPFPALEKSAFNQENRMRQLELTAPASLGGRCVLTIPLPLATGLTAGIQVVVANEKSPALTWVLEKAKAFGLPPT